MRIKKVSREKQVKELTKIIGDVKPFYIETIAEALYDAGYRNAKQFNQEVVKALPDRYGFKEIIVKTLKEFGV